MIEIGDNLFCLLIVLVVVGGAVIVLVKRRDITIGPDDED